MEDKDRNKVISIQELISSSIDGELNEFERRRLYQLLEEGQTHVEWERYQLISDVLQGHFPQRVQKDFSAGVMAEIGRQSTDTSSTEAPSGSKRKHMKQGVRFAIAASVAVVAIMVVQQVRLNDDSDTAMVEELAIVEPASQNVPQIAPVAADQEEQIPLHYSATASSAVNTQLVGASQQATVRSSLLNAEQSEEGNDPRMLDPYIINHAEVASGRVMTPYLDSVGSFQTEDK